VHRFEFPGYIPPSELKFETLEPVDRKTLHHPSRHTLNEIYATAICGNDLTSSVLYVIGVTTTLSGQLAPLCLLAVGLVLYLFKSVYGEVRTVWVWVLVGMGMGVGVGVGVGGCRCRCRCERAIRTERPVRLLVCLANFMPYFSDDATIGSSNTTRRCIHAACISQSPKLHVIATQFSRAKSGTKHAHAHAHTHTQTGGNSYSSQRRRIQSFVEYYGND
jgi:hypothetical protein